MCLIVFLIWQCENVRINNVKIAHPTRLESTQLFFLTPFLPQIQIVQRNIFRFFFFILSLLSHSFFSYDEG